MKSKDISLLNLFDPPPTDLQTSSVSKMGTLHLSNAKRKQTKSVNYKSTGGAKSKITEQNSYCCKMGEIEPTHLPCGAYVGALPDKLFLKGIEHSYAGTIVKDGTTYDTVRNKSTNTLKTYKRENILNYLIKNAK